MVNKKRIIEDINAFIKNAGSKLTQEELAQINKIREDLFEALTDEDIAKSGLELLKFILLIKDIFY